MCKSKVYKRAECCLLAVCLITLGICLGFRRKIPTNSVVDSENNAQLELAKTTALAAYPELVTYTLGKMTGDNNSYMPSGDTYEDNAYTRYLKEKLNIQNKNVISLTLDDNYDLMLRRMVIEGNMPDVMIVDDYDYLTKLVENGLIEDLTESYENCATSMIKDIYNSYGNELLDSATFDGKLMALPSTQVYPGCSLLWLRDDWRKAIGLDVPHTLQDVENILEAFKSHKFNGVENVGIVSTASLVGMENTNYSMDPVFAAFDAYPQVWIKDDEGNLTYGSINENTKNALAYLNSWYKKGILDQDYMMRTPTEIGELVRKNQCGAFFGWWWAPNNPLKNAKESNPSAEWVPYLITDDEGKVNSYVPYRSTRYVVVRKGYEYPEVVTKITSVLFDEARYGESKEIEDYATSVDVTARPLVINCDYSQGVFYATNHILGQLNGTDTVTKLNALERAYLAQCREYLSDSPQPVAAWCAYASRIQAVSLIQNGNVSYINKDYVQSTLKNRSQKLRDMETMAFMKIVTGEETIDYFDTFVSDWKLSIGK